MNAPGWLTWGTLPVLLLVTVLMASPAGVLSVSAGADTHALPPTSAMSHDALGPAHSTGAQLCAPRLVQMFACPEAVGHAASSSPGSSQIPSAVNWKQICYTGNCGPGQREDTMMAYDAADGYTVLFGGFNGSSGASLSDTWTFSGGVWTQIFPTTSPPPRFDGQMAYDPLDGYVVLFGGIPDGSCSTTLGDTWTFSGGQWTQLSPTTSPTARFFPGMAWDPSDNEMILFGGTDCLGNYYGDTWSFVGGQWTQLFPTTSPSTRFGPGMETDTNDNQVLLFGGGTPSLTELGDTWSFAGGAWTQLFPTTSPSARVLQDHLMASDSGSPMIFGGYLFSTGACDSDTWAWSSGSWTQESPTSSPGPRGWSTLVGTPAGPLLYGGYACAGVDVGDTWQYISGPHVSVPVPTPPAPVEAGTLVNFLSTVLDPGKAPDTFFWSWGPNRSMQCTPSTSLSLNCTPLRAGSYYVVAHITDSVGNTGSTASALYTVTAGPEVSAPIPDVLSADVGQSVIFNSTLLAPGTAPDVYSWTASGVGMGCPTSNTLTITCVPTAPGTYNVTVKVSDSMLGAGWNTSRTIVVYPLPVSGTPIPTSGRSIDVGQTATFKANVTGVGSGRDSYLWSVAPLAGLNCAASFASTVSCLGVTAGAYNVTLTVVDSNGGTGSAALPFRVFSLPAPGTPAASASSIDVGQNVSFSSTSGTSGSGGLSYVWGASAAAFGCGSNTLATYRCTPSGAGAFQVFLTVTDSNGGTGSTVSSPFTVYHLPRTTAPVPSVANPEATQGVTFSATTLDPGSGMDVYTWTTSDPAEMTCTSSAGSPTAVCSAAVGGSYTVTLQVTDSNGGSTHATSALVVVTSALQATASSTPASGTATLTVTFASSAWGGSAPYSYSWRFGDSSGDASSLPNPTHTYTSGGTFTAVLFVNDTSGHSVMKTVTVSVASAAAPTLLSSVPGGLTTLGLILLLAILVVVAFVLLLRRRSRLEPGDRVA